MRKTTSVTAEEKDMAAISLKCPNCGGELVFDPKSQDYQCPYCGSDFTQKQIDGFVAQNQEDEEVTDENPHIEKNWQRQAGEEAAEQEEADMVEYRCPSCGAEIVTDATTAATFCYYCHNPVVLSGRVSGTYLPRKIIPFSIDREKAEKLFLDNVSKKKFVPKGFLDQRQIENLSGVYFPYWMVDWDGRGRMEAKATRVRVYRQGDTEITETRHYDLHREGTVHFSDMSRNALKQANRELVEGVQPYQMEKAKPFSIGYLSGFQAQKRDMEQEEFAQSIKQDVNQYTERILRDSMEGYNTVVPVSKDVTTLSEDWQYTLLPVWVLTYRSGGTMYYYTINGQTGKVCGKLPVHYGKLGAVSAVISLLVCILMLIGGWLI